MYILGIAAFIHDPAAALLKDGKLVAAAEEERFNRIKHSYGLFPHHAINYCLIKENIKPTDVDYLAYYFDWDIIFKKVYKFQPSFERFITLKSPNLLYLLWLYRDMKKKITVYCKKYNIKPIFVKHHLAHAAGAYFSSNLKKANILTLDGRGEIATTFLGFGDKEIEEIKEIYLPHSLGYFYAAFTEYLGFTPNSDEWKVMGLASYGENKYKQFFDRVMWKTKGGFCSKPQFYDGLYRGVPQYGDSTRYLGAPRKKEEPVLNDHWEHIAASLQAKTEEIIFHLAKLLENATGSRKLCLSGGVALNSKVNGLLLNKGIIDDIFIQPQAGDSGGALGSAMYAYNKITGKRPEPVDNVYYGPEYSDEEIKETLDKFKLNYDYCKDIDKATAELLTRKKIVGWFQGRMEIGPRALGARSILANPSEAKMKDLVNACVKQREYWRPFAISMLHEYKDKYLQHKINSPFMILVDEVTEDAKPLLAAGVHVDGTTRPQTVEKRINPKYYSMIKEFGKQSGVYAILNTSFNLAGEPIVMRPEEAIKDFYGSGMDNLAIGNYLLRKK